MDFKNICKQVCDLSIETGEFIRQERATMELKIETKGLNDFVTHVDKASEIKLVAGLKKILPEAGFIAEEGTETTKGEEYNWVVDPIDGTTNFIHGLSPYAISIALTDSKNVLVGVIYEITHDECFSATLNGPAFLNGKQINVSNTDKLEGSLIATGFPYNDFSRLDNYIESMKYFMKTTPGIRRIGSAATDMAYVACGRFEAFYEYALHPWDIMAGIAIVRSAGGVVTDFTGGETEIDGAEIVATNAGIYNDFMSVVKQYM